jgi:hypothetical protein
MVLGPDVAKVNEQLPAPAVSIPLQPGSPLTLETTVYVPVGLPFPVTVKAIDTGIPTVDGLGVSATIVVVEAALTASVDWVAEAAR